MTRIEEIEARLEKATQGEWYVAEKSNYPASTPYEIRKLNKAHPELFGTHLLLAQVWLSSGDGEENKGNAELMSRAPADLRYLLDRVRELEDLS